MTSGKTPRSPRPDPNEGKVMFPDAEDVTLKRPSKRSPSKMAQEPFFIPGSKDELSKAIGEYHKEPIGHRIIECGKLLAAFYGSGTGKDRVEGLAELSNPVNPSDGITIEYSRIL